MHAIDTPGSVAGRFSEGNPAIGQRATKVSAAYLNDNQDNLLFLLAEAGIVPTKGRAADVTDAIKAIVAGAVGSGGGSVPTARTVTGAGLATGGGDLSTNRVLTVTRATAAEVLAGSADDRAITPLGLRQSLDGGLAGQSFQFGPLVLKAGQVVGSFAEGPAFTPFAVPFPNACWAAIPVPRNDTSSHLADTWVQMIGAPTREGFTAYVQRDSGSAASISGFGWFAIGV